MSVRHCGRRGSALVTALIVVSAVAALAAAVLQVSGALTRSLHQEVENTRAFYLAEAGLNEAYQALRVGRRGQIGSEEAPAAFGQGLLWVDATELDDTRVRFESTGVCGRGRATLALVVEPLELPLGFFSEEDLVVDDVLLVDGYDSDEGEYIEQVTGDRVALDRNYRFLNVDEANGLLFQHGTFYRYHAVDGDNYVYDHAVTVAQLADQRENGEHHPYGIGPDDFTDDDWWEDFQGEEYRGVLAYFAGTPPEGASAGSEELVAEELAVHTASGGQIGSNGSVSLTNSAGGGVAIYGDAVPGPGSSVSVGEGATVTGETESRLDNVVLPEVELPELESAGAVAHDGPVPLVIGSASASYTSITVAVDAELVVRGPCTLVVGNLELQAGAELTLDTSVGDISLYIEGGMNLAPGSALSTSGTETDATSIQVAEIASPAGTAPITLEADSEFYGTIYAPDTAVRIGSEFEVFGSLVARSLDLAPGVRLHFDAAGFDGSPFPRLLSWRVVEIPSVARRQGDPFQALGVPSGDLEPLADSHDLAGVFLAVSYLDRDGVMRSYSGPEADFDWTAVALVVDAQRALDEEAGGENGDRGEGTEQPLTPPRQQVEDAIADMHGEPLRNYLLTMLPLRDSELFAVIDTDRMMTQDQRAVLVEQGALAERILERLLTVPHGLTRDDLKHVVIENSPLSPEALGFVEAASAEQLSEADKAEIYAAQ
ncbi:MAG: hypothetical protein GY711_27240 [bacterium]|nr:hypothetical protein [bacterium]